MANTGAFPASAGQPQYSGNFLPAIWAGKLVSKFYGTTVFGAIANTDYEGLIRTMGDTVHIRTVPSITIKTYYKGMNLSVDNPDSPGVDLPINKGKNFAFIVDDVDKIQSDLKLMDQWSNDASEQMKIAIDTLVLGDVYADIAATNKGAAAGAKSGAFDLGVPGASIALTKTNVLDYIVDMGTVLDEANVPETGRWLVIPAWVAGLIKKSDLKDASLAGDNQSVMRNGRLGMIDRFTLYSSNHVATVADGTYTCYYIMAGTKHGITFASQMTEVETLRAQSTFGNIVRGLNIFGYKVVKGDALALLYGRKG